MPRFYLPPQQWDQQLWMLEGDEAKHAVKVLRMRDGDACTLFDGRGNACEARISAVTSFSHLELTPLTFSQQGASLSTRLILCQAIPKGSNMDWIIQKAVELGISEIHPIMTDRTISRVNAKEAVSKQEKWQRIALEACKQCGQNLLPLVTLPLTFNDWVKRQLPSLPEHRVIASLAPGALPLRHVLEAWRSDGVHEVAYLVGPEGDFTSEEISSSLNHGFIPVSLGPITLRVETATFLGLSALRYALDI